MREDVKGFLADVFKEYAEIPEKQIDMIVPRLRVLDQRKGSCFLRQGDEVNRFGLIRKGLFRIFCNAISGDEKTLAFRGEGQFLAGFSPYLEKRDIWYSMEALEDSRVLSFDFADYHKLAGLHPCWNELIKNYVTKLFIEKEERERSLLLDDAATRYRNFLESFPEYEGKISQYHIASYIGITPVSLSRIRSGMK